MGLPRARAHRDMRARAVSRGRDHLDVLPPGDPVSPARAALCRPCQLHHVAHRPDLLGQPAATRSSGSSPASGCNSPLGLITALLLNRSFAWRGIARALIVVPWALPSVIIGLVWTWMLDFNLGILNEIGVWLGLLAHPIAWLAQPTTAMCAVILAIVWQGFPFFAVTLLAGLQAIPGELYEAASLDGARAWGQFATSHSPASPASSPPLCSCARSGSPTRST